MRYLYKCEKCKITKGVEKLMQYSDRAEYCEECGNELIRVYSVSSIKTGDGVK